jgi:hypothetical protein
MLSGSKFMIGFMGQNLCLVFDAFSPTFLTGIHEIKDLSLGLR